MAHNDPWSVNETALVMYAVENGVSSRVISEVLERSVNAVRQRISATKNPSYYKVESVVEDAKILMTMAKTGQADDMVNRWNSMLGIAPAEEDLSEEDTEDKTDTLLEESLEALERKDQELARLQAAYEKLSTESKPEPKDGPIIQLYVDTGLIVKIIKAIKGEM